ncbi:MAG: DUF1360 domain-containing protein [Patescibacteria group bacterium]|nr:DUF1360 domain-containing protein [Patescibacteria group bacterium]
MALAVLRITRLLVYDKITRFAREWFLQKRTVVENGKEFIELKEFQKGFRHTIHDLLQCPWCVAVWASLVVVFCYFEFTWSWYVIFMLAVAGVGSFLQVSANAIGWYAEAKKTATLEMRRSKTIETGRE